MPGRFRAGEIALTCRCSLAQHTNPKVQHAEPPPPLLAPVICTTTAIADAATYSDQAVVLLGEEFAAQVCYAAEPDAAQEVTWQPIALAAAKTIVSSYVECVTDGVTRYGEAEAFARTLDAVEALAGALRQGWQFVLACDGCPESFQVFALFNYNDLPLVVERQRDEVRSRPLAVSHSAASKSAPPPQTPR